MVTLKLSPPQARAQDEAFVPLFQIVSDEPIFEHGRLPQAWLAAPGFVAAVAWRFNDVLVRRWTHSGQRLPDLLLDPGPGGGEYDAHRIQATRYAVQDSLLLHLSDEPYFSAGWQRLWRLGPELECASSSLLFELDHHYGGYPLGLSVGSVLDDDLVLARRLHGTSELVVSTVDLEPVFADYP